MTFFGENEMIATIRFKLPLLLFAAVLVQSASSVAQESRPQVSPEGLELVSSTDAGAFYVKPGTTLSEYKNAELLAAFVSIDEEWVKDYNREVMRTRRLRDKDIEEIKTRVANDFWDVFGGDFFGARTYKETQEAQPSKLILRPAIINVSLASVNSSGQTVTQNLTGDATGSMTLVLEIYDAASSELLGRMFNLQTVGRAADFGFESSSTDRADEQRVYKTWASDVVAEMKAN